MVSALQFRTSFVSYSFGPHRKLKRALLVVINLLGFVQPSSNLHYVNKSLFQVMAKYKEKLEGTDKKAEEAAEE